MGGMFAVITDYRSAMVAMILTKDTSSTVRPDRRYPLFVMAVLAILAFFTLRSVWLDSTLAADLTPFYHNAAYQADLLLDNFPIYKQTYADSCGPTSLRMLYSYLVQPVAEQAFATRFDIPLGQGGMLPNQFATALQTTLTGYKVSHQVAVPDPTLLAQIYQQLQHGIPVPIYFSTVNAWHRPNFDTHYSVVIGIRPQQQTVVIANAYGWLEVMTIPDFLGALKYHNYRQAPLAFRLGQFFGVISPNNLFLVKNV